MATLYYDPVADAVVKAPPSYETVMVGDDGEPCCCGGCEFCPCCARCPGVSSFIDFWIEGQNQDPDFLGVCDCPDFTTPVTGVSFDDCDITSTFPITCDNSVRFQVLEVLDHCVMRATLTGNSAHSGSPPGGPWEAVWEKTFAGPIECSDLHELAFVSQTGGDDLPCDFSASTFFADILIPA